MSWSPLALIRPVIPYNLGLQIDCMDLILRIRHQRTAEQQMAIHGTPLGSCITRLNGWRAVAGWGGWPGVFWQINEILLFVYISHQWSVCSPTKMYVSLSQFQLHEHKLHFVQYSISIFAEKLKSRARKAT